MKKVQSTLLSPLKSLSGFFILFLLFLSVLCVFFLFSPSPFIPFPKHSLLPPPPPHNTNAVNIKPHTDECDLFQGKWIPDQRGPLYNTSNCETIPETYKCLKYGRNDTGFLYWRWKPHQCDLPSFDPYLFLELLRGKNLAFVGDSVARNHMESLLCLLSQAETPVKVYKDKKGYFQTWNFPSTNLTLKVIFTRFLVKHSERQINGTYNLHIDQIDPSFASNLRNLNYAVVSIGHWLFRNNYVYNQTTLIGCVFCVENDPKIPTLTPLDALRMVVRSALTYIDNCEECGDLVTVLRTYSPSHFENGTWNGGGYCNRTRPVEVGEKGRFDMEMSGVQIGEMERVKGSGKKRFWGMDVTKVMLMRPDGHPGQNWPGKKWAGEYNDCTHWCMPGPVDSWSEFLMEVLRREVS